MPQELVLETANNPGSATTIDLAGAPTGYRSWLAGVGAGVSDTYMMRDSAGLFEWGRGYPVAGAPNKFVRQQVLGGSAGAGVRVSFTGAVDVYSTFLSADMATRAYADTARIIEATTTPTNGAIDITIPDVGNAFGITATFRGMVGVATGRNIVAFVSTDGNTWLSTGYNAQIDAANGALYAVAQNINTSYFTLSSGHEIPLIASRLDMSLHVAGGCGVLWTMGHVYDSSTRGLRRGWGEVGSVRPKKIRFIDSGGQGLLAGSFVSLRRIA